jgi:hypothetical protein
MVECRFLVQGNLECSRVELEAKGALKIPGGRLDEMAKTQNKKQPKRQFGFGFGFWNPNEYRPALSLSVAPTIYGGTGRRY